MLPLLDPRARADQVLIVDLLKGIRTKALDLVAAIDDLVEGELIGSRRPGGAGETDGVDAKAPPIR